MKAGLLLKVASSAAMWLILAGTAQAGWQYCLTVSDAEHKVYMSGIGTEQSGADAAFAETVERAGLNVREVQCPRADTHQAMEEMRQYAIQYNRNLGNTVVPFNSRTSQAVR